MFSPLFFSSLPCAIIFLKNIIHPYFTLRLVRLCRRLPSANSFNSSTNTDESVMLKRERGDPRRHPSLVVVCYKRIFLRLFLSLSLFPCCCHVYRYLVFLNNITTCTSVLTLVSRTVYARESEPKLFSMLLSKERKKKEEKNTRRKKNPAA